MVDMPLSILQTPHPISISKNCHAAHLRGVEQGVNESDPAPPFDLVSASEEICAAPE
jgi:hypothetical protein